MFVRCIGTGSQQGNCYALYDNDGKILLLDLGLARKQILKGIGFNVSDVVGAVVSHGHGDHARAVKDFENMGMTVFKPYIGKWKMAEMDRHYPTYYGKRTRDFKVFEFDMTDNESEEKSMLHNVTVKHEENKVLEEFWVIKAMKKDFKSGFMNYSCGFSAQIGALIIKEQELDHEPAPQEIAQFLSDAKADFVSVKQNYRFENELPF